MRGRALTIVVLFAVAGCAGSDVSTVETESPTTSTAATTTTSMTPVNTTTTTTITSTTSTTSAPSTTTTTPEPATFRCRPAPDGATEVLTGPLWQFGDERRLELTARRNRPESPLASSVTDVDLSVVEEGAEGWTLLWSAGSSLLDGTGPELAQAQELVDELPREEIRYTIDELGLIVSVDNVDEIRADYLETIATVSALVESDPTEAETWATVEQLYASLSDDELAQLATENVLVYHALEGYALSVGDSVSYDDVLPNALGGEPFPATSTVELTDLIDDDGCVTVKLTVRPDPVEFDRILRETVADVFGDGDSGEAELFDEDSMIENLIVGQFDYQTGQLWRVVATQTISIGPITAVDTTSILDVTPEDG